MTDMNKSTPTSDWKIDGAVNQELSFSARLSLHHEQFEATPALLQTKPGSVPAHIQLDFIQLKLKMKRKRAAV